jgi:hypothetical protein
MWSPEKGADKDLLATTGDYLRIWDAHDGTAAPTMSSLLNTVRYCRLFSLVFFSHIFFICRARTANIVRRSLLLIGMRLILI